MPGSGIRCSWEIGQAGAFSALVPISEVRRVSGWQMELRGQWLWYEHPTGGPWGGVIVATSVVDGIMEIVGQSWEIMLRKRLATVGSQDALAMAPPGGLFQMALASVLNSWWTPLYYGSIDGSGAPVAAAFESEDFYDSVAPALTIDAGFEWTIDENRNVHFLRRIGGDATGSVHFDSRNVVTYRFTDDLFPITNRLFAVGIGRTSTQLPDTIVRVKKKKKKTIPGAWVEADFVAGPVDMQNTDSMNKYGALEEYRDLGFVGDENTLAARAREVLNGFGANSGSTLELTIADTDNIWSRFTTGDSTYVNLGATGAGDGVLRVMSRGIDVDAGTMLIAGDYGVGTR